MKTGLKIIFCGAFVLAVSVGCSPDHVYIYRDLEVVDQQVDESNKVSCGSKLRGAFIEQAESHDGKRLTIVGTPYEMWIWFKTERRDIKSAMINSLKFFMADGQILDRSHVLKDEYRFDLFDLREKGVPEANFLFDGIELPHERCSAQIEVIFELKSGEQISATYSIELTPIEHSEERIDWWDNIMSV